MVARITHCRYEDYLPAQAKFPAAIRETRGDRGIKSLYRHFQRDAGHAQTCQTCQRHDEAIVLALKGNIEGETAWATG